MLFLLFITSILALNGTDNQIYCVSVSDCSYNGNCVNGTCICTEQWTNKDGTFCNYYQKSQFETLLLSIFTGFFGVDQIYMEYYIMGVPKLVCGLLLFGYSILLYYRKPANIGYYIMCMLLFSIVFSWWLSDIIKIITMDMTDGNNMMLFK